MWTGDGQDAEHYRDTAVLVRGPVVPGMRGAFVRDWLQTPHPLVTGADCFPPPDPAGETGVQVLRAASEPGWNEAAVAVLGLARPDPHHHPVRPAAAAVP
jgi:cardiolipin synthase